MSDHDHDELTHFELVGEFHDVFGHPSRKTKYVDCFDDKKLLDFRMSLIYEEFDEFRDAYQKKDMVEMADALCDMLYVTFGMAHVLGINFDDHAYKLNARTIVHCDEFYPDLKLLDHNNPAVDAFIQRRLFNINKCLDELTKSIDNRNFDKLSDLLVELSEETYALGYDLEFDMDSMFREVHRSNMTKVCDNLEDANKSVDFYVQEGRYKKPSFRMKNNYYVIYDAETSKILKNYKWETPNIEKFFE